MKNLHIGIIPDGNRRYGKENNLSLKESYKKGLETFEKIVDQAFNNRKRFQDKHYMIKELTIYVCSKDNIIKRTQDEVNNIEKLIKGFILYFKNNLIFFKELGIKINIIGDINLLNEKIKTNLLKIIKYSKNFNNYIINLAICYDGREEIVDAINKNYLNHTVDNISKNLSVKNELDIVIRTGYMKRMSGFFPWQTIYSEWFFLDKYWPEFDADNLFSIIQQYNDIQKNRGI